MTAVCTVGAPVTTRSTARPTGSLEVGVAEGRSVVLGAKAARSDLLDVRSGSKVWRSGLEVRSGGQGDRKVRSGGQGDREVRPGG